MKKYFLFSFSIFVAALLPLSFAFAQGEDLIKAQEDLDESIAELNKEEEPKSEEEIAAENEELVKRVDAFNKVLAFTKLEIEELSKKFADLEYEFGDKLWDFYKEMRRHFNSVEKERVEFEARVIDNDSNLDDIKALAAEFKQWREGGYDEKNEAFFDFAVLVRVSDVIELAKSRANRIDSDLDDFEDDFGDIGSLQLQVLFAQAQLELGRAESILESGDDLFERSYKDLFFPVEIAESEEVEQSDELGEEVLDGEDEEEIDVSVGIVAIAESVLLKVQDAYKIFIDMSELAEQLLREE